MPRHYHASPYHRSRSAVDGSLSFLGSVLSITWHEIVQPHLAHGRGRYPGGTREAPGRHPGNWVAVLYRVLW